MAKTGDFKHEQRSVALAMAGAFVTTVLVLAVVAIFDRAAPAVPFETRLQMAIRADLFVICWLAAAIANVARLRFFSERDIAGSSAGSGTADVQQAGAILQNTLEQVGLAIFAHMIVAATFRHPNALIETLVCLFAIGRLLFWVGYRHGAKGRAFGFALTFYPSVGALLASAAAALLGLAG